MFSLECLFNITDQKGQGEIALENSYFPFLHFLSSGNCSAFCLEGDGSDVYEKWISRLLGDLFSRWLSFGLLLLKWTISGK